MEQKLKRIPLTEYLYLAAAGLWILTSCLGYSRLKDYLTLPNHWDVVGWVVLALLVLAELIRMEQGEPYSWRDTAAWILLAFIAVIDYTCKDNSIGLFMTALLIYGGRTIDFKKLLKLYFGIVLTVYLCTMICVFTGGIENIQWSEMERLRLGLGFIYPTFASHLALFLSMTYTCIRRKLSPIELAAILMVNLALYQVTDTRTDLILLLFFFCAYYLCRLYRRMGWSLPSGLFALIKAGVLSSAAAAAALCFVLERLFEKRNPLVVVINWKINGRLELEQTALAQYGLTLFGQRIKWVGMGGLRAHPELTYNYVDCSYIKYLLNYGIIFFALLMLGLTYMNYRAIQEKDEILVIALLSLYAFSIIDAELCVLGIQPFVLYMGGLFRHKTADAPAKSAVPEESQSSGYFDYTLFSKHRNIIYTFAIITVLLYHGLVIRRDAGIPLIFPEQLFIDYIGSIGVDLFLLLSGVGIYQSMGRSTLGQFYRKRALRILLPYTMIAGSVYFAVDILKVHSEKLFLKDVLWYNWLVNGVNTFWYALFILCMYLVYPLIYRVLCSKNRLRNWGILFMATFALVEAVRLLVPTAFWKGTAIAWGRMPIFVAGCYLGVLVAERKQVELKSVWTVIIGGFLLKICSVTFNWKIRAPWNRYLISLFGISLCLLLILVSEYLLKQRFWQRIWNLVEPYTFELYLWNVGLWTVMAAYGFNLASRKIYLLLLAIDVVLSVVVHWLCIWIRRIRRT